MHHFVGADSSCISWGHAQNGELGYGPAGQKYVYATLFFWVGVEDKDVDVDVDAE